MLIGSYAFRSKYLGEPFNFGPDSKSVITVLELIKKLSNNTIKWSGLKNLDLAEVVTTNKNYIWKGFKTWKKEIGYKKNVKTKFKIVAID